MAASAVPRFTHGAFLEMERQSPFRHEYLGGLGLADLYRRIDWTA